MESIPRKLTAGEKMEKEGELKNFKHLQKKRSWLEKPKQLEEQEEETEIAGQQEKNKSRQIDYGHRQSKWEGEIRAEKKKKKIEMDREEGTKASKCLLREKSTKMKRANERIRGHRAELKNGGFYRENTTEDDLTSTCSSSSVASKTA